MAFLQPPTQPPIRPHLISTLTNAPYILSISPLQKHLILSHPAPDLTLLDRDTLQVVSTWKGHTGDVKDLETESTGQGGAWTASTDGTVRRWDERTGSSSVVLKNGGKKSSLLSVSVSPKNNLVAAGTELTSHESSILFWDPRKPNVPLRVHTSTHSDDVTSLSFTPPSLHHTNYTPSSEDSDEPAVSVVASAVLLSGSTDGLLALSNCLEDDEDEAVLGVGNVDVSVAECGWIQGEEDNGWAVWARDDMDGFTTWNSSDFTQTSSFASMRLSTPESTPADTQHFEAEYIVSNIPHMNRLVVGSNSGSLALLSSPSQSPSSVWSIDRILQSGFKGHRDVVRASCWDFKTDMLYTGSEDGVVVAWKLEDSEDGDEEMDGGVENDEMEGVEANGKRERMEYDDEKSEGMQKRNRLR